MKLSISEQMRVHAALVAFNLKPARASTQCAMLCEGVAMTARDVMPPELDDHTRRAQAAKAAQDSIARKSRRTIRTGRRSWRVQ